jgi:hypothetical protein
MRPFLTVVTRTYNRPRLLADCKAGVEAQTDTDIEHVILSDDIGRGIYGSYRWMADEADRYHGQYIYCLDDDNVIIDTGLVADLRRIAAECDPDVIMVKADHPTYGRLPRPWDGRPVQCRVDLCNFVVKAGVWKANAHHLLDVRRAEDFGFIDALWKARYSFYWHDATVVRLQQVGNGLPEGKRGNLNTARWWDQRWQAAQGVYEGDDCHDAIYHRILEQLPARQRILDIGGGLARFSRMAVAQGHSPFVIDLSPWAIAYLRGCGIPGQVCDLQGATVDFGTFDVAVCTEVIEHLEHPGLAVALAHRSAPRAFFSTPYQEAQLVPEHLRAYTVRQAVDLVETHFGCVRWERIGDAIFLEGTNEDRTLHTEQGAGTQSHRSSGGAGSRVGHPLSTRLAGRIQPRSADTRLL